MRSGRGGWATGWLALLLVPSLVAACAGGASPATGGGASSGATLPSASQGAASAPAATAAGGGGGTGDLGDPCALLKTDEVTAAFGTPMKDGVKDPSTGDCTWDPVTSTKGGTVIITLKPFDAGDWAVYTQLGTADKPSTSIPGVGDEAILVGGTVLGGLAAIHKGAKIAEVQVLGTFLDAATTEQARTTLLHLIASRM